MYTVSVPERDRGDVPDLASTEAESIPGGANCALGVLFSNVMFLERESKENFRQSKAHFYNNSNQKLTSTTIARKKGCQ